MAHPEMTLCVDAKTVGIAARLVELHEQTRLARPLLVQILGVNGACERVDGVDRSAIRAEGGPVGNDDIVPEPQEFLAVPAPEGAGRLGFVVVHGAEIEAAIRSHMAVIDAVAGLVRFRRHQRLDLAAPQVEPHEAGFEARDQDIGVAGQRHEADAFGHNHAGMLAGSRMVAPDRRILDVDPKERIVAVIPNGPLAKDATACHRDARRFHVDRRMRHLIPACHSCLRVGNAGMRRLVQAFGDPSAIRAASLTRLRSEPAGPRSEMPRGALSREASGIETCGKPDRTDKHCRFSALLR
jgi:hypothetical protein